MVDDSVAYALVAATGFFLAVSFGLLYRYRQASNKLNESSDLGRDLWQALEHKTKKQDERIVDLMARLEVLQARVTREPPTTGHTVVQTKPMAMPAPVVEAKPPEPAVQPVSEVPVAESRPMTASQSATPASSTSQPTPEIKPQSEDAPAPLPAPASPKPLKLDNTSRTALELLKNKPLTTEELWTRLKRGREHTSRVMKNLYERGLVTRDDANKPYTYQLTEEGRRYVQ